MNQDPISSPQDSLQFIEQMINKAQNRFHENGHLYLLWGWVIFTCSILHFVVDYWDLYPKPQNVWILTWAALIYQSFYISKKKKQIRVKTYTDEIVYWIWIVFVVLMALVGFIVSKAGAWYIMYPLYLVLYGVPTFLIGVIIKFPPLKAGGISCWLLAVAASFVPAQYSVLFIALAVLSAWIIPGYLLRSRFKLQN